MKRQYSFILNEFSGNCAAGITGYEGGIANNKSITSKPINSLLKARKKNRGNQTMRSLVFKKEKSKL